MLKRLMVRVKLDLLFTLLQIALLLTHSMDRTLTRHICKSYLRQSQLELTRTLLSVSVLRNVSVFELR